MKKSNSLNYLENKIDYVVENYKGFGTKEARIEIFNVFNRLANYILLNEYGLGAEISSEIAINYSINLVDKIIKEDWSLVRGSDYTNYMRVDLEKHLKIPFGPADMDLLKAFERFSILPEETLFNYEIFCEINDILLLFFDETEVKRYIPLFMSTLSNGKLGKISTMKDENFKYFSMLLISLAKKVSRFYINDLSNSNHKDFTLGELTYLLSVTTEKYPELSLNLDLQSLKNLVDMCGGMTLKVPTKDELDNGLKGVKESFRFPLLAKKQAELEKLVTDEKNEPCKDAAFEFFLKWLENNKTHLSTEQLDKLWKTLGNG